MVRVWRQGQRASVSLTPSDTPLVANRHIFKDDTSTSCVITCNNLVIRGIQTQRQSILWHSGKQELLWLRVSRAQMPFKPEKHTKATCVADSFFNRFIFPFLARNTWLAPCHHGRTHKSICEHITQGQQPQSQKHTSDKHNKLMKLK